MFEHTKHTCVRPSSAGLSLAAIVATLACVTGESSAGFVVYSYQKPVFQYSDANIDSTIKRVTAGSISGRQSVNTVDATAHAENHFMNPNVATNLTSASLLPNAFALSGASNSVTDAGPIHTGTTSVLGAAYALAATVKYADARAFSSTDFQDREIVPSLQNGTSFIRTLQNVELHGTTGGITGHTGFGSGMIHDPMNILVRDRNTGQLLSSSTAFSLNASIEVSTAHATSTDASLVWNVNAGLLSVSAYTAHFDLSVGGPLLDQQGTLAFTISGGTVTESISSGIFSGLLPSVGSLGTFDVPLSSLTLGLNFNNPLFRGHDISAELDEDSFGEAFTSDAVPEPSSIVLCLFGSIGLMFIARSRVCSPAVSARFAVR